jgi:hypothetical protein
MDLLGYSCGGDQPVLHSRIILISQRFWRFQRFRRF